MTARLLLAVLLTVAATTNAGAAARNFFSPAVGGVSIDACLADTGGCGKPAADAFCKSEGFVQSILFQREPATSTLQPATGKSCEGEGCTTFRQIKCYRPEAAVAAVQ